MVGRRLATKIRHIITRLIIGGAQENTLASCLGLRERHHHDVALISGPTSGPEGSLEPVARQVPGLLRISPHLVRPIHPWHDALALLQLTRALRQDAPDIVHTHSGKAGLLGRLAARRAGVPLVIHGIHGPSFGPFQGAVPNLVFRNAERLAGALTDHFVVVAQAMRDQYLAAGIAQPADYTRIFSGFPLAPWSAPKDATLARELGIQSGDCVVGMIARLFKLKGHDDLLDAAPELLRCHPALRFLLVGDGLWRERLESRAQALGVRQRFVFAGLVDPAKVPAYVRWMDMVVHLSRREGLPRALPQALAAGIPVVAADCDGAREICLPDQTGILIRPGDRSALIAAVLRLAADAALRQRLGACGRDLVCQSFSVDTMVDDLHHLYLRLWDQRTRKGTASTR